MTAGPDWPAPEKTTVSGKAQTMINYILSNPFTLRTNDFSLTHPESRATRVERSAFGDLVLTDSLGNTKGVADRFGNVRAGRDGSFPIIGHLSGPGIVPLP